MKKILCMFLAATAAAFGAPGGTPVNNGIVTGITSVTGAVVRVPTPMAALVVDVTKGWNSKTIGADTTFTFSGTPATANQFFPLFVTNSDSVAAHVLTVPTSFAIGIGPSTTTLVIPPNGKLLLTWGWDGTTYNLFGAPPATTGSGSVVLSVSPTLTTPIFSNQGYIADQNSQPLLQFTTVASAAAYFNMSGNISGSDPILSVQGAPANMGIDFQAKGTGAYQFLASSGQSASVRIFENPTNGSNYAALTVPASLASNFTLTLPAITGTIATSDYSGGGTGATAFTQHGVVTAGATALGTVAPGLSGNVLTSNGTDWISQAPTGGGGTVANPTALVGMTAVNGTATSAIRSDGAPAIDPAIQPTWTGTAGHIFEKDALGATTAPMVTLQNLTNAANGAQQISPSLYFYGSSWTTGSGLPNKVGIRMYGAAAQGSSTPVSQWGFDYSLNGGSTWTNALFFSSSSGFSFANTFTGTNATLSATLAANVVNSTTTMSAGTLLSAGGSILSSSATGGVGYKTGAGGAVTQATSRTTGVTLNTVCGVITTNTTSLTVGTTAVFTVTDSAVAITDVIGLSIRSGQVNAKTQVWISTVAAGSFNITVFNGDTLTGETGAILINFAVQKATSS